MSLIAIVGQRHTSRSAWSGCVTTPGARKPLTVSHVVFTSRPHFHFDLAHNLGCSAERSVPTSPEILDGARPTLRLTREESASSGMLGLTRARWEAAASPTFWRGATNSWRIGIGLSPSPSTSLHEFSKA